LATFVLSNVARLCALFSFILRQRQRQSDGLVCELRVMLVLTRSSFALVSYCCSSFLSYNKIQIVLVGKKHSVATGGKSGCSRSSI